MPTHLVIFDFDGVLADTEDLHRQVFDTILRELDLSLSNEEYLRSYLGLPDDACLARVLETAGRGATAAEIAALVERKRAKFAEMLPRARLYPGVPETLAELRRRTPLAIASGAFRDEIESILDGAGVRDLFAAIVSAEDVSRGKPNPDPFLRALGEVNRARAEAVAAGHCLVVEDAPHGIEAALAAEMRCVAVATNHPRASLGRAEMVLDDVTDLLRRPELLA